MTNLEFSLVHSDVVLFAGRQLAAENSAADALVFAGISAISSPRKRMNKNPATRKHAVTIASAPTRLE